MRLRVKTKEKACETAKIADTADVGKNDPNRYIDRPFNVRPLCFWAFFAALTVVVCHWAFYTGFYLVVPGYFAMLIALFFALQFLQTKDQVVRYFGSSRLFFTVLIVLCLTVAGASALTILSYTTQKSYAGYGELEGVVESYNIRDDGSGYFMLVNAHFEGADLSGRVMVYVTTVTKAGVTQTFMPGFATFDKVSLEAQLKNAAANDYNINSSIKYTANIKATDTITAIGKDTSVRSTVLRYARDFFGRFLNQRNSSFIYSMLFGDKSELDTGLQDDFRLTGMAHVLAVSGLHVGLIVGILVICLNFLKVSKKRQFFVILSILLFYCYLCDFRYSILRSSIMFLVITARRVFLRSTDMLSSLSLAGIIILILFPFSLYSASFQLSFACIFGVTLFYLPMNNFFMRTIKIKWLSSGVAMYFCTLAVCLPFFLKYFGMVSLVGIILNVMILPLIVLAFQASVISLVTWITFPVLYLVNPILDFALNATDMMAHWSVTSVFMSSGGDWFLIYLIGIILMSRFIFMQKRLRWQAASVLVAVYAASVLVF